MTIEPVVKKTKNGLEVEFSCAWPEEAAQELECLKRCCAETPFLLSEPEDIHYTEDGEKDFINNMNSSGNSLLVNVYVQGKLVGNSSFAPVNPTPRLAHRCSLGIAIFKEYCGIGIGTALMEIMIENARNCGYEMMELDVVTTNKAAISLYEKCGFKKYGTLPQAFRYKDGSYGNLDYMFLNLKQEKN